MASLLAFAAIFVPSKATTPSATIPSSAASANDSVNRSPNACWWR
ncbi:MAG TPA: hypothetical protein VF468_20000 [Actinomycetota bacterium]|nr:hypothetical protein [Actinomycetota bacterium]